MAEQCHIECRESRRIGRQRRRRRSCHLPAAVRGARYRLGPGAQQQGHHSALSGGKRQPARRGEVEGRGLAGRLDDDRSNRTAAGDISPRSEGCNAIRRVDQEQSARRDSQLGQAMPVRSRAKSGFRLPYPENGFVPVAAPRQQQGKGGRARRIWRSGIHLVESRPDQSSPQSVVQCGRPK